MMQGGWEENGANNKVTSRPCMVFLACVNLALFLALYLSSGNSFVSSWCDNSMLASLLWQLSSLFTPALLRTHSFRFCFLCCPRNPQNLSQPFHLKGVKTYSISSFFLTVQLSQLYIAI